jgi:hypothetical protein
MYPAALGPVLALLTFISSMGNGPLAAILQQNGVSFSGILAYLFSDFTAVPSMRINARYYGRRFTAYLAAIFAASSTIAATVLYALFTILGLMPEAQPGRVQELAGFAVDSTLFLNLIALAVAGVLVRVALSGTGEPRPVRLHRTLCSRRAANDPDCPRLSGCSPEMAPLGMTG